MGRRQPARAMLIFHTALHGEARALIARYQLKRRADITALPCFAREDIFLVESDIGRVNTAAALGWFLGWATSRMPERGEHADETPPALLNVGMAGHESHAVGTCFSVNRVEDAATGARYYPPQTVDCGLPGACVLTLDRPTDDYPEDCMVDMEAAAFMQTGGKFTPLDLCRSLKIIADNRQHPAARLKDAAIEALVRPHVPHIERLARGLQEHARAIAEPAAPFPRRAAALHLSRYQRQQLARLLRRQQVLAPQLSIDAVAPTDIRCGKALIRWLEDYLNRIELRF